jgi:DNA processing protein
MDVIVLWDRAQKAGVRVAWFGSNDYPARLVGDPNPPGVLFWRGSLGCLSRPTAAIVGTRNATPDGRAIAFELGRDLAEAGVCVVSGLALGVDGAAHHGALDSFESDPEKRGCAPLGAAASGVDVPYPRRHCALWERVCEAGAIVSETPPGQPAQAWRFPTRNRIIAALSDLVVVVESHPTGGSLITAEAALERGIEVRAVPGPVRSPASEGCHQLLYDGAGPVRGARDVLDALGVFLPSDSLPRIGRGRARSPGQDGERRPVDQLNSVGRAILDAVGWRPTSVGLIVERTGLGLGEVAGALERLEALGLADRQGGWWTRV